MARLSFPTIPKPLIRLLSEFRPYRVQIVVVSLLGILISAVQPIGVKILQLIVDGLKSEISPQFYRDIPMALVGLFFISGIAKYLHNTLRRGMNERVVANLRVRLYEKFIRFPMSHVDRARAGELLSGIQNDLQQVGVGSEPLFDLIKEPLTLIGLIGVAFAYDWRLTCLTMILLPPVAWLFQTSGQAVRRYAIRTLGQASDLLSISQESLSGLRIIKIFGLEGVLTERFRRIQMDFFRAHMRSIRVQELSTPAVELLGAILTAAIVIYGAYRVQDGQMTAGQLIAFLLAFGLAQMPIKKLNEVQLKLRGAEAAAERIYNILDVPEGIEASPGRLQLTEFRHSIEYRNVEMRYFEGRPAVSGVSFEMAKGSCLGLVGLSGSGKSTVASLLPRLYDYDAGQILLDGVDLKDCEIHSVRRLISYVTQDTFLFHDTIEANIWYGNPLATREEVEQASRLAHCWDFIQRCPHGMATRIGDRGVQLSGGERQRIAIARAFLKQAPILILDEATSSLDSRSEAIVQTALEELMVGRTTLLIAHRLSTVAHADQILVFEQGRIVERGTHAELIQGRGLYANLYSHHAI